MGKGKSLMRSLGEFVGHIAHAVRTQPERDTRRRTTVQTRQQETPEGRVTLRRTVIEEIEIERDNQAT